MRDVLYPFEGPMVLNSQRFALICFGQELTQSLALVISGLQRSAFYNIFRLFHLMPFSIQEAWSQSPPSRRPQMQSFTVGLLKSLHIKDDLFLLLFFSNRLSTTYLLLFQDLTSHLCHLTVTAFFENKSSVWIRWSKIHEQWTLHGNAGKTLIKGQILHLKNNLCCCYCVVSPFGNHILQVNSMENILLLLA